MAINIDFETLQMVFTATVTASAILLGVRWKLAKNKLNQVRKLLDEVDDAVKDDKITEDEFRNIWTDFVTVASEDEIKAIFQKLKAGLN